MGSSRLFRWSIRIALWAAIGASPRVAASQPASAASEPSGTGTVVGKPGSAAGSARDPGSVVMAAGKPSSAASTASDADGAASARADGAPDELRQRAAARYEAGAEAYRAGRYEEAVAAFLAADELVPSAALSFNVARALEKLDEAARALAFYRDYLRRDPHAMNGEAVRARIAALEATLLARGEALLCVLTEPSGTIVDVDGRAVGATPWAGVLAPGTHRLTLARQGYRAEAREVVLSPRRSVELSLTLAPTDAAKVVSAPESAVLASTVPTPSAAPQPTDSTKLTRGGVDAWPILTLSAGGAALMLAGAFELSRRAAEADARAATTQIAYADRYDAMRARQTTARLFAVAGGALLVTGGVLVVLDTVRAPDANSHAAFACDGSSCFGSFASRF